MLVVLVNWWGGKLDRFIGGKGWEDYWKYELEKDGLDSNEKEYKYLVDSFSRRDKYEEIMEIYGKGR